LRFGYIPTIGHADVRDETVRLRVLAQDMLEQLVRHFIVDRALSLARRKWRKRRPPIAGVVADSRHQ